MANIEWKCCFKKSSDLIWYTCRHRWQKYFIHLYGSLYWCLLSSKGLQPHHVLTRFEQLTPQCSSANVGQGNQLRPILLGLSTMQFSTGFSCYLPLFPWHFTWFMIYFFRVLDGTWTKACIYSKATFIKQGKTSIKVKKCQWNQRQTITFPVQ